MMQYFSDLPQDALQILHTLLLSFLIGVVRESTSRHKALKFGGVRHYPLIGLLGYLMFRMGGEGRIAFIAGLFLLGVFLAIYFFSHLKKEETGFISELASIVTYLIGGFAAAGEIWLPVAVTIIMVLLISSRDYLENLARRIPPDEIMTFVKFLLLSLVILPIFPNKSYTPIGLNPYKIWLFVVIVNGLSYISYLLQLFFKGKGSIMLFSILGGAYSSTVTTIVLSKQSGERGASAGPQAMQYVSGILMASSAMYLRILVLVLFINRAVFQPLLAPFLAASLCGIAGSLAVYFVSRKRLAAERPGEEGGAHGEMKIHSNPLDLGAALVFAGLFTAVTAANYFAKDFLGDSGTYTLSIVMGFTDVDPFILSVIQGNGHLPISVVVLAIILATSSNNLLKGLYSCGFARNIVGRGSLAGLVCMSMISLIVYFFLF